MEPPWWRNTRGEWWVIGQGIVILLIALAPPAWRWPGEGSAARIAVGAALMAGGLGLAVLAAGQLGVGLTPLPRPRPQARLIRTGVYAHSRHPIYGGLIVAAFGWAVVRNSGLHLLLAAVLTVYFYLKSEREEQFLVQRFPEYTEYRSQTKRFLPWLF
ncbi:MAG: isoprenylcysteine carboxylmethyltransferase family protein [Armatimonadota bacterium]|nr:isoprenylcysteine carboxylmethyltransferase family protein [Armatimonadota bacterium]MDR5697181.1 isoprenylcysteine carboxylmethyltransferase family protein [Armatimonadota bacterium]